MTDGFRLREDEGSFQVSVPGDRMFFLRVEKGLAEVTRVTDFIEGDQTPVRGAAALDLALGRCGLFGPVSLSLPAEAGPSADGWHGTAIADLAVRRGMVANLAGWPGLVVLERTVDAPHR